MKGSDASACSPKGDIITDPVGRAKYSIAMDRLTAVISETEDTSLPLLSI